MKIIEQSEIRSRIGPVEALEAARSAFRALGTGSVQQPSPMTLDFPGRDGEVHIKAAYIQGSPIYAVKMASGFYDLPEGRASGNGSIVVFDADDGAPLAVLADNGYLTDLRTGAAGALATEVLAPAKIRRVAVLGAGAQARFQIDAIAGVRDWEETVVWARRPDSAERYASDMARTGGPAVRVTDSVEAALADADIVVTTTASHEPIVRAEWLASSATVIAVGSDSSHKQELDTEVLARADKVIADDWSQCLRLGEIHHAVRAGTLELTGIHAELGKVITGERVGRERDELIVCDLTGVGALDAAIAEVAWRRVGNLREHLPV